jgi:threonine dehydrogenase-like Zn-dependent dehydrogenase
MQTMRAAVMRDRKLVVADVPAPTPGPGEVLVRTLACGICGSDLHALKFADQFVETARRAGNPRVMDLGRDVIMGHEFCAEIVEHGPGTTRALKAGSRVCSRPVLMPATGPQSIGYSNDNPGGYAQYMRLSEALLLEVPNGLPTDHAALTEPMAVGVHAVAKARLEPDELPKQFTTHLHSDASDASSVVVGFCYRNRGLCLRTGLTAARALAATLYRQLGDPNT